MLVPAIDVVAESVGQAEMLQVTVEPACRARRCDGARQVGRQRADEIDRSDDRPDSLAQRLTAFLTKAVMELRRKLAADPLLDGRNEVLAGEPDIISERVFDTVP